MYMSACRKQDFHYISYILFPVNLINVNRVVYNVHATIPKGNMVYDQYTVPDTVAVKTSFVAFL